MKPRTPSVLLAVILSGLASQGLASDDRWYLSPTVGYVKPDDKLGADDAAALGLGLGKALNERWNVELGFWGSNLERDAGKDADLLGVGVDALYFYNRNAGWSPYALVGLGMFHSDHPDDPGYHLGANIGLGIARALANDLVLRADARYRLMETDLPGAGSTLGDWLVNVGVSIPLGPKPAQRPAKPATAMAEPSAVPVGQAEAQATQSAAMPAAMPAAVPAPMVAAPAAPADSDADGVADALDKCPATPADRKVNAEGCELDGDGDGVVDALDKCPATPAGRKVDAQGCETDGDGDGVVDGLDKCPATPAGRKVNAEGCELDSDSDGVVDGLDKCPATPTDRKVDAQGCETDGDGDGVIDALDKCPATPKGDKVDASGCTVLEPIVLKGVNFDSDSAKLRPESAPVLDKAAETLQRYPHISVEVAGHTDSTHTDTHNRKLSEERAKSVCDYFIQKGIEAQRLRARGYGEAKPSAENATPTGREANRRVEILIEEPRK